ncbi:hypothetical protein [Spirulina sp. 06S082]|uniref:hypothetical protein n=1 Tax=Spirulina sp. 06S082 TaxID=3110248 RepID=UPI002B1EE570|nr:hypothetical protein [Spirulina sp. 06S082]MEA5469634.1 hypothetical protein [Spirulina sp. 06S082]
MNAREVGNFAWFTVVLVLLVLFVFGILQWLGISAGSFIDWIVGLASIWWLIAIVTIPWNIHFSAKEVLVDADRSRKKEIPVDSEKLNYVRLVMQRSLWVAIGLHIFSALGLYLLALTGVSRIGYVSSAATLSFTGLRPAVSFYQYLAYRLHSIRHEFKYPREDIVEVWNRLKQVEASTKELRKQLNFENADSIVSSQQRQFEAIRQDLTHLASSHEGLKAQNQADHDRIAREAKNAIAQLSEDSEFLDRVREIIRFFKQA